MSEKEGIQVTGWKPIPDEHHSSPSALKASKPLKWRRRKMESLLRLRTLSYVFPSEAPGGRDMKSLAGLCVVALALLAGCAQRTVITRSPAPVMVASDARFARSLGIPPGHLPPPGECRIWYPDRPPGHQPPPGPCRVLKHKVPPGAYLIHG